MLVGLLLISSSGCTAIVVGAATGVGTATWLSGKLTDEIAAPYQTTVSATRAALKSLNMPITKEVAGDKVTQIRCRYTDGASTWIDIKPLTATSSSVEVRVGTLGHKDGSSEIIEAIRKNI